MRPTWCPRCLLALLLLLAPAALLPAASTGRLVVVVAAASPARQLERREVQELFMGRRTRLDDGSAARAVDFAAGSPLRQDFYAALTGRSEAQVDAYWAQLVFAGRMRPPARVATVEEMADKLRGDPELVGYLPRSGLGDGLRVVYELGESR